MKKLLLLCSLFVGTSALVSCSSDDDSSASATSITLSADAETIEMGASVTLSVMNNLNDDVTATSTYYLNGSAMASNIFTPSSAGTYTIHAENGSLVSNTVSISVEAVQQQNAVWFDEENFGLTTSGIVFWGGSDPGQTGTTTHAYWSLIVTDASDVVTGFNDVENRNNYADIEFLTALNADGTVAFPTTENVEYLGVYEMYLDGELVCDYDVAQADGSLAFAADITGEETSAAFVFYSLIDGTSADIDYDSAFEGAFDGSGGRPGSEENAFPTKNALPLTLN